MHRKFNEIGKVTNTSAGHLFAGLVAGWFIGTNFPINSSSNLVGLSFFVAFYVVVVYVEEKRVESLKNKEKLAQK